MESFSGQMQDSTRWSPSAKHRWHTIQRGVLIIQTAQYLHFKPIVLRYEQLELQGRRGRRSVCPSSTVNIQRKKCGYLHKLPNHTQVCRLPMWFAIVMLPPQLHCTLGTMVQTKGSITQKNMEAVTEKNPRFAQFEQERKPADTTPSLSLSLFWFSFPYHSHRVKRNL